MGSSILVFGANGTIGTPLVRRLIDQGENVKAVSRSGRAAGGAVPVKLEFDESADFESALTDVSRIFLLTASGQKNALQSSLSLISAAAERAIKVVYLSAFGAGEHPDHDHAKVEKSLRSSGVKFVSLRPNWFSDNFHTFWKPDIVKGRLQLPAGEGKSSFIDARDIAECAAVALSTTRFDGRLIELTGPNSLDCGDPLQRDETGYPLRTSRPKRVHRFASF